MTAISLGDVMVTQLPETKGQLIKARVIDNQFNSRTLHNLIKLGTMGFGSRLSGGFINFSALCIVEQFYALAAYVRPELLRLSFTKVFATEPEQLLICNRASNTNFFKQRIMIALC